MGMRLSAHSRFLVYRVFLGCIPYQYTNGDTPLFCFGNALPLLSAWMIKAFQRTLSMFSRMVFQFLHCPVRTRALRHKARQMMPHLLAQLPYSKYLAQ